MGHDLPLAHRLLRYLRQLVDQRQPPRHPARAAGEARRQLLLAQAEDRLQLSQQPPLLQRRLGVGRAQRPAQHQRLDLGHRPHRRLDHVLTEPRQRAHSLVTVDHHVAAVDGVRHHHDRQLLPVLGQRRQQPPLRLRPPHSQPLVAKLQLVVLQVHPGLRALEPQPLERPPSAWHRAHLVLRDPTSMSSRIPFVVNNYRPLLGLHGPHYYFRHYRNGISGLDTDLVLHDVPR
jgi:hypothetical protein